MNFHLEETASVIALSWHGKEGHLHVGHGIEGDGQGPGYVGPWQLYKVCEYFSP